MARFKYIGEAPNGPFQMYGAEWDAGKVSEVSDPSFVRKLNGNQFFEAVGESQKPLPDYAPEPEAAKPKKVKQAKKDVIDNGDPDPSESF